MNDSTADTRQPVGDQLSSSVQASLETLRQEMLTSFKGIQQLRWLPCAKLENSILAVALIHQDVVNPTSLGQRMISWAADKGVNLVPLLYRSSQWTIMEQLAPDGAWMALLEDPIALMKRFQPADGHPRQLRKMLLLNLRQVLSLVRLLQLPHISSLHLKLALASAAFGEALTLLFATKGHPFYPGADSQRFFEEQFVKTGCLKGNGVALYLQLQGFALQTQLQSRLTISDKEPMAGRLVIREVEYFVRAMERYVEQQVSTQAERDKKKRNKKIIAATTACLVAAGVVWAILPAKALPAIADASVITKPGGIVGRYFQGTDFQLPVLQRTDSTIHIDTMGAVDPKVGEDRFSVRWQGFMRFSESGWVYLCTDSDDGVRLFLGDRVLLDQWSIHRTQRDCKKVKVERGWHPLRLDFFDEGGRAEIRLLSGKDLASVRPVPAENLCCRQDSSEEQNGRSGIPQANRPGVNE